VPFRKLSKKKGQPPKAIMEIPVLCRLWEEDSVWNASAVDLPIAVFGESFEAAKQHMTDAIVAHLDALQRLGELEATAHFLRTLARQRSVRTEDMALNQPLIRISAAVQDKQVYAVV